MSLPETRVRDLEELGAQPATQRLAAQREAKASQAHGDAKAAEKPSKNLISLFVFTQETAKDPLNFDVSGGNPDRVVFRV